MTQYPDKKRGERFQQHPNPLATARKTYGLSQAELAHHLNITTQIVQDNELGLSMHPNRKMLAYLTQSDPALRVQLSADFYAWRADRRADQSDPEGPQALVEALSSAVERPETFRGAITLCPPHSVRGFCRMFIIQTSIVNRYLDYGYDWGQISLAFEEAGFSSYVITWLHNLPRTGLELAQINQLKESSK